MSVKEVDYPVLIRPHRGTLTLGTMLGLVPNGEFHDSTTDVPKTSATRLLISPISMAEGHLHIIQDAQKSDNDALR